MSEHNAVVDHETELEDRGILCPRCQGDGGQEDFWGDPDVGCAPGFETCPVCGGFGRVLPGMEAKPAARATVIPDEDIPF